MERIFCLMSPGDLKLMEGRDCIFHSSVFSIGLGMSYPYQVSNICEAKKNYVWTNPKVETKMSHEEI
jgi:hypothetical protein